MDKSQIIETFASLRPNSMFLVLEGYRNQKGELANHCMAFHISWHNALLKSLEQAQAYEPRNALEEQAKTEVLASLNNQIYNLETTPLSDKVDGFIRFHDEAGKPIQGIRVHESTLNIHVFGLAVWKKVIEPGIYKPVNSKPITLAKKAITRGLPISRFRTFVVGPDRFDRIAVDKKEILPPTFESFNQKFPLSSHED